MHPRNFSPAACRLPPGAPRSGDAFLGWEENDIIAPCGSVEQTDLEAVGKSVVAAGRTRGTRVYGSDADFLILLEDGIIGT